MAPARINISNFDQLTEAAGCDESARAWLKTALDPFHDYDVQVAGIPDNDSQNSVVQIFNEINTITAPVGLAAGQTWSAHIAVLPLARTVNASGYWQDAAGATDSSAIRVLDGSGSLTGTIGTVTVVKQGTGLVVGAPSLPTDYDDSYPRLTSSTQADVWQFNNPTRSWEGHSFEGNTVGNTASMKKLIAGGFEVHNDTAALYKQGSVTVYGSPMQSCNENLEMVSGTSSTTEQHMNFRKSRQPPASSKEAAQLPNSRTWEAADGVYVPIRLGDHTDYSLAERSSFRTCWQDDDDDDSRESGYVQYLSTTFDAYRYKHRPAELECTGAYFSGLSAETVLTLKTKFIVESAPTAANQAMLAMATPTPAYCPRAMEIYHRIQRKLPPGVPVHFNDKGDWFRMVTSVIRDAAPVIAPFLSVRPGLAAGVTGVGALSGVLNKVSTEHKANKGNKALAPQLKSGKNVSSPNRR